MRNLIIDLRQIPSGNSAIGLHWQVAQATSLINVVVEMSTASGTQHQGKKGPAFLEMNLIFATGMFMENGRLAFIKFLAMFAWFILIRFDLFSGGVMGGKWP